MPLHLEKIDEVISPGLTSLKWNSLNIDSYIESVQVALKKLDLLITRAGNILATGIEGEMAKCSSLVLFNLPDIEPWTTEEFIQETKVSDIDIVCLDH